MNKKTKIKVIIGAILIILSVTACVYSYLQLASREKSADVDLFSLVPENSVAILETDNVSELMESIGQVSFAQQYDSLHISDLLSFLKNNIGLLKANTAHGLSSQMNQMLISFHSPGDPKDQVLYGKLASGDEALVENLIKKNYTSEFPAKTFEFEGEKIQIYPLGKDEFLACYFKPGFYAVSFQKKLIEEVIHAHKHKQSILNDAIFTQFLKDEKSYSSASLYIKAGNIPIGNDPQKNYKTFHLSRWTAFKINMKGNALYLTGNCIDTDTCNSFENILKSQKPIEIFPSRFLPESTSFFYQLAISDFKRSFSGPDCKKEKMTQKCRTLAKNDSSFYNYLTDNAGDELRFIIFHDDRDPESIRKVMNIKMKDQSIAAEKLHTILEKSGSGNKRRPVKNVRIGEQSFEIFQLPGNTVFSRYSSNPNYTSDTFGCFYNGNLLVSPSDSCIHSYIRQIETGKTLEGDLLYEKCILTLSSESNYLSVADMEDAVLHPDVYGQLMPNFFIKYKDFFKHFYLTLQFTCVNGNTYPYFVLMYKGA